MKPVKLLLAFEKIDVIHPSLKLIKPPAPSGPHNVTPTPSMVSQVAIYHRRYKIMSKNLPHYSTNNLNARGFGVSPESKKDGFQASCVRGGSRRIRTIFLWGGLGSINRFPIRLFMQRNYS
jgi:hypothetical protein